MRGAKGLHESWQNAGCTGDADWFIRIQGELSVVQRRLFDPPPRSPKRRGSINGFSRSARFRMLKWIACVDWSQAKDCRFISLTYPDDIVESSYGDRAKHKYLFLRSLETWLGAHVSTLWRCEWIDRKSGRFEKYLMPHFHLLCFGVPFLQNHLARGWWRQAINWDGHVDTDVKRAPKDARVSYYVAKYAGKVPHLDIASYLNKMSATGRQWGVTRRTGVPMHPVAFTRPLNRSEVEQAKDIGRRQFSRYGEFGEGGYTMLGNANAAMMREKFADALASPGDVL